MNRIYPPLNSLKVLAFAAIPVFFVAGCASLPERTQPLQRGDYTYLDSYVPALVTREMSKHGVVGLSIAVIDNRHVVWTRGFGYADKQAGVAASPQTIYRAGMISSLLTSAAAMRLAERGAFNIDRPIAAYVPRFNPGKTVAVTQEITARTIMTHHSGLTSDYWRGAYGPRVESIGQLVASLSQERPPFASNYVYSYSNAGMSVLGYAMQQATGRPFEQLVKEEALAPLGMDSSSFSASSNGDGRSKSYRRNEEIDEPGLRDIPALGLNTSVLDVSRFIGMVLSQGELAERQFLKPESIAETLRVQNMHVPLDVRFKAGLAWALSGLGSIDIAGVGTVAHLGSRTPLSAGQLIVLPEQKLGVVVFSNTADSKQAVDEIATSVLKTAVEIKTGIRQAERIEGIFAARPDSLPPLESYVGVYDSIVGLIHLKKNDDRLEANVLGRTFSLTPREDSLLGIRYKLGGLIPVSLGILDGIGLSKWSVSGHELMVASFGEQAIVMGEQLKPSAIPEQWRHRIGSYAPMASAAESSIEVSSLSEQDGFLILECRIPDLPGLPTRLALRPISDTEAVVLGLGQGRGDTLAAVSEGGRDMLRFSGLLFRPEKK